MEELELYVLDGCPYCNKVLNVLEDMDIPYSKVKVPSSHSEREEVKKISDQTSVPVLNDPNNDVKGMNESDDIVNYLKENYEYPEDTKDSKKDSGILEDILDKLKD